MTTRVLDVGNCAPDHAAICEMVKSHFNAVVDQAHGLTDTMAALRNESYALVTVNRQLDRDGTEGVAILKAIKADAEVSDVPVMLITNYPDHTELAVHAGGVPGFGKLALQEPSTIERLRHYLA